MGSRVKDIKEIHKIMSTNDKKKTTLAIAKRSEEYSKAQNF